MNNDHSPSFLRKFYEVLKVICEQYFLGRSKSLTGSVHGSASSVNPIEAVFEERHAKSHLERVAVVEDLIDSRVNSSGEFAAGSVQARIDESQSISSLMALASAKAPTKSIRPVLERIAAISGLPTHDSSRSVSLPAASPQEALLTEFTRLAREELSITESLAQLKSGDNQQRRTLEDQRRTCQARKAHITTQLKGLTAGQALAE
jgi:hypothetical protein